LLESLGGQVPEPADVRGRVFGILASIVEIRARRTRSRGHPSSTWSSYDVLVAAQDGMLATLEAASVQDIATAARR
jgi:hypothetical protein